MGGITFAEHLHYTDTFPGGNKYWYCIKVFGNYIELPEEPR